MKKNLASLILLFLSLVHFKAQAQQPSPSVSTTDASGCVGSTTVFFVISGNVLNPSDWYVSPSATVTAVKTSSNPDHYNQARITWNASGSYNVSASTDNGITPDYPLMW